MKGLRGNIRALLITFVLMFSILGVYIGYTVFVNGTRWFVSPYNPVLSQQKQNVIPGAILDRNYKVLAQSNEDGERVYNPSQTVRRSVANMIGDPYGISATGVELFQAKYLLGFSGNLFERIYQSLSGEKRKGENVVTTLDSDLSAYILEKMGSKNGSVVVMNYKTGEILAAVSNPNFDPVTLKKPTKEEDEDKAEKTEEQGELVNRATMGRYTPGSVFKIVTMAAVLEYHPELIDRTYTCTGSVEYENGEVVCSGNAVHGEQTLAEAFAHSCNCVFAQLAKDIGQSDLEKMATKMGFNEEFLFDDLILYKSNFVSADPATLDGAWSAAGQYLDTATPLHICMITSAVANDGVMMEPKLIKSVMDARNYEYKKMKTETFRTVMTRDSAEKLREMMVLTVKSGTGRSAAIKGYTVGGKTGSAEVSDDKSKKTHAWYTGFIYDDEHPLAVTVILEHAGSGGSKAAPVAASVLKKAMDLGY